MSQAQTVALLSHVEVEIQSPRQFAQDQADECERLSFTIVPDNQADYYSGYLGVSTPLAQAILGCHVGNRVVYQAGGEACKVRILSIAQAEAAPGAAGQDLTPAEERREAVRQAQQQIADIEAMIFASTVEGKWGEYEVEGFEVGELPAPDEPQAPPTPETQPDGESE